MARTPNRPGTVLFVAVILFLAGAFDILLSVCGGGSIAMLEAMPDLGKGKGQADPLALHRFVTKEVPGYLPFFFGSVAVQFILGIVNIVLGVGLLRMSSTARVATILLVVFDLLLAVVRIGYNAGLVIPAQSRFVAANPAPEFAMTIPTAIGGLAIGTIITLAVAITILVLLNTKSTKEAFAAAGKPPMDDDEDRPRSRFEGYDDERPPETGNTDRY